MCVCVTQIDPLGGVCVCVCVAVTLHNVVSEPRGLWRLDGTDRFAVFAWGFSVFYFDSQTHRKHGGKPIFVKETRLPEKYITASTCSDTVVKVCKRVSLWFIHASSGGFKGELMFYSRCYSECTTEKCSHRAAKLKQRKARKTFNYVSGGQIRRGCF